MSFKIMWGMRSAVLSTCKSPPCLPPAPILPTAWDITRAISSSPSSLAWRPTNVARLPISCRSPWCLFTSVSRASTAATRRSRVVKPMQYLSRTTGKSITSFSSSACFTSARDALGGNMASCGRASQRSPATTLSIACGNSGARNGIFFRIICSSSKPRSLMSLLRKRETATLIINGGTRFRSLAQPVMKMTTATDICLNPQSMAALPIMA
mmetsp:Transcript_67292/g.217223  ORF Transcript_67292/g.217223 Transcript_67292/m.217223 type:complete len:211 (+) Transcript_67292:409-1041(+)